MPIDNNPSAEDTVHVITQKQERWRPNWLACLPKTAVFRLQVCEMWTLALLMTKFSHMLISGRKEVSDTIQTAKDTVISTWNCGHTTEMDTQAGGQHCSIPNRKLLLEL